MGLSVLAGRAAALPGPSEGLPDVSQGVGLSSAEHCSERGRKEGNVPRAASEAGVALETQRQAPGVHPKAGVAEGRGGLPWRPPAGDSSPRGLGLAQEGLSFRGHLGTGSCPECPAPHPHGFSSFLPFSFLINHTLLPNLNMECPGPRHAVAPGARRAVGRARGTSRHRLLSGCVKLCAQKASPYRSV